MIVLLFRELRAPFTKQRGGKFPKQRTEAKRLVRPGWTGSHAGVTQAFRGAKRASGDRRRGGLLAGTRQSQSGEKRRAGPIFARQKDTRRRIWRGFGRRQFERLKRFSQHGCIFLSVIAVPTFPQCKGADSIIWNGGFAVRNDVFDGLARTQFHATSKKLLCGNRSDTSLLIVARLLCDPLTDNKVLDFDNPSATFTSAPLVF